MKKYNEYQRNHAIIPGQEQNLFNFLNQPYKGKKLKLKNAISSNSEDALTWSCFKFIENFSIETKKRVLDEIMEDAFQARDINFKFVGSQYSSEQIEILIGKKYTGPSTKEDTEVDASIELPDKLIFFEAKLYSSLSLADTTANKPFNQIAKKLRIGLDCCNGNGKEFYFIFLDIAPIEKLYKRESRENAKSEGSSFQDKWKSAWWFNYYKKGHRGSLSPLKNILEGVDGVNSIKSVSENMGWLSWSDLYKIILRGIIEDKYK
jgi:hypothetical protein